MSRSFKDDSQSLFYLSLLGIFCSPIWLLILVGLMLPLIFAFGPLVFAGLWAIVWIGRIFKFLFK